MGNSAKILLSCAFASAAIGLHAQTADTLSSYLDRNTGSVQLYTSGVGYMLGTSSEFVETGVHYDAAGVATVTELMVFFGDREVVGTADVFQAKVYEAGADSMPNLASNLGTGSFTVADMAPSGFATFIPINNATSTSSGFFVSVVHAGDDTLAVLSSNPAGDGQGEKRTRQGTRVGMWKRSNSFWSVSQQNYDGDALIIPIVSVTPLSVSEQHFIHGISFLTAFPNPSLGQSTVQFELAQAGKYSLSVFDLTGRMLIQRDLGQLGAGTHQAELELLGYPSGSYRFVLQGPRGALGGKIDIHR